MHTCSEHKVLGSIIKEKEIFFSIRKDQDWEDTICLDLLLSSYWAYRTGSWMMSQAWIFISIPVPVSTILVIMLILNASLNLTLYILFLKIKSFEVHYKSFFFNWKQGSTPCKKFGMNRMIYLSCQLLLLFLQNLTGENRANMIEALTYFLIIFIAHIVHMHTLNIFYEDMILSPHSVIRI